MTTNLNIIYSFIGGRMEEKHKRINLFIEKGVIYSYGKHWPLGVHMGDKKVLVNGSKYSRTTSKQTSILVRELLQSGYEVIYGCTEALENYINKKIGGF